MKIIKFKFIKMRRAAAKTSRLEKWFDNLLKYI